MPRFPPDRLDRGRYASWVELPVLYGDLDTNSHVNNVMMGRFFEHARFSGHQQLHLDVAGRLYFLVARVTIDYLSEGRFGTPIAVGSRLASVGGSSLVIEQIGFQHDTVVALCETVLVHLVDGRPTRLPDELRDLIKA